MKLLGLSPLAAPLAAAELRTVLASPTTRLLSAGATIGGDCAAAIPSGQSGFPPSLFKKIDQLIRDCEQEMFRTQQYREGGLDADIASLRSVSRSYKQAKQSQRDRDLVDLITRARSSLWP